MFKTEFVGQLTNPESGEKKFKNLKTMPDLFDLVPPLFHPICR
ncbi:hypothetical protein MICA_2248 [Micavibrio aeruginosavorus ARL-13]|uniref:Uncharacterized protein n=1 Tax=Micavibrio aeruginosavorus (strain ARL-13) TaxID=856793 RepID=G2KS43_MICAA|nr:hypothetical protein MICA_2248 [Micavibrio aeruginosavorus ARL-13]